MILTPVGPPIPVIVGRALIPNSKNDGGDDKQSR